MSKVFFSVTMSLDGFMAPEARADDPKLEHWFAQWSELQAYALAQKFLREKLRIGTGGETGPDNQLLEGVFARTGATIMGKRMFDAGEHAWPEEAPFNTPVMVMTHQVREPWVRKGGTTFYFVNDGIEAALVRAREVAGDRDIRIGGGGATILEYLNAGLVDEFHIALAPVFFGAGVRLFDKVDVSRVGVELVEALPSKRVTHLRYRCVPRA